jgi:hypothetical protein
LRRRSRPDSRGAIRKPRLAVEHRPDDLSDVIATPNDFADSANRESLCWVEKTGMLT